MQQTEPWKTCQACNGQGGFTVWQASTKKSRLVDCHQCEGTGSFWFDHTYELDEDPPRTGHLERGGGNSMSVTENEHDSLCLPGISPVPPEKCIYCILVTKARQEERNNMANVSNSDLVIQAYARGREDAAVAVREFPVH